MHGSSPAEVAAAYLAHTRSATPATEWAYDAVTDFTYNDRFEELWGVIVALGELDEEIETETLAVIAAGPLEDLICKAGPQFIDRVERAAKFNAIIGRMLTGVWGKSSAPLVWERVVRFCRAFPNPIDDVYRF